MVFNGNVLVDSIFFVFFVWIVTLTIVVFRMVRHYNRLTGGDRKGLKDILESLLVTQKDLRNEQQTLYSILDEIRKDGKLHIQRVGLIRFNPFSDTGGSQSFTLAILDGKGSGLVMTSLYGRSGHRWYVKEVVDGKGKELALSKEEQAAIKNAYE